jgi:hypothetical protein
LAEEKKEPWLNYLALTTIFLAVLATFAQFRGGGHSTRSIMKQAQASDMWAHYQAKSIKGNTYAISKERIELDLRLQEATLSKAKQEDMRKLAGEEGAKVARYEAEQKDISAKAKQLEAEVQDNQEHGGQFGKAMMLLQIAIVLSSIAALLKKKLLWFVGLLPGACGAVFFLNGFLLFFR